MTSPATNLIKAARLKEDLALVKHGKIIAKMRELQEEIETLRTRAARIGVEGEYIYLVSGAGSRFDNYAEKKIASLSEEFKAVSATRQQALEDARRALGRRAALEDILKAERG